MSATKRNSNGTVLDQANTPSASESMEMDQTATDNSNQYKDCLIAMLQDNDTDELIRFRILQSMPELEQYAAEGELELNSSDLIANNSNFPSLPTNANNPGQPCKRPKINDDGFKFPDPKHTAKRPVTTGGSSVAATGNKYEALGNPKQNKKVNETPDTSSGESNIDPTNSNPSPPIVKRKRTIKPVTVYRVEDYIDLLVQISCNDENKFHARITPEWMHLYPDTEDDHRKISKYVEDNNIQGYITPIGNIRPIKIVIRDLPRDFPVDRIRTELIKLGYEVIKVAQMSAYLDNSKLRMYQVQLQNTEKSKEIMGLEKLCHIGVRVERYISPFHVQQCHRCQKFHHHSDNCLMEPRCVKCAEKHLSKDCPLPPPKDKNDRTGLKCANCGGNHTANYRGCKSYPKKFNSVKNQNNNKINNSRKTPNHYPNTQVNEKIDFSPPNRPNAWANKKQATPALDPQEVINTPHPLNPLSTLEDLNTLKELAACLREIRELLGVSDFRKLLPAVVQTKDSMIAASNNDEKVFAFSSAIVSTLSTGK